MKILSILAIITFTSIQAFARDSSHLVCAGYMSAEPGPDNYGIAIHFDESRGNGGMSRIEVLSAVWAGDLYQGTRINESFQFGANGQVVMSLKNDSNKVFYKGAYNLVKKAGATGYDLQLKGELSLLGEKIDTTLSCVDISN